MSEALLGVAMFSAVVLGLVLLVLLARRVLLPEGTVAVRVNDRREVEGARGRKLLEALAAAEIALPAACGGKGTCGQCRVEVLGAAPAPLPADRARLSRRELAHGWRLACQLVLRDELAIRVPDAIFGVRRIATRVRSARLVGTMIREIVLELPEGEKLDFRAGSFVQVTAPPYAARFEDFPVDAPMRAEWERLGLFGLEAASSEPVTRAYSLANPPADDRVATLLVRLATPPADAPAGTPPGIVSSYLFSIEPGAEVEIAGPYGNFFASDSECEMIFVGGGAGMAPLRSHVLDQLGRLESRRTIGFWYGARNRRELFYAEEFERLAAEHPNFRFVAALSEPRPEDGWQGEVGFIHDVLQRTHLASHPSPELCEYYLCGPPLMVKATRALLDRLGVPPESVRFDDFGT